MAVSSAYYTLFHFLISEAVANWNQASLWATLGRAFDHAAMKSASSRVLNAGLYQFRREDPSVAEKLRKVAKAFIALQDKRHTADYNNSTFWTRLSGHAFLDTPFWTRNDALDFFTTAERAFALWQQIRTAQIAQAYLVSFLVKNRA